MRLISYHRRDQSFMTRYVQNWGTHAGDVGLVAVSQGVPAGAAWMRLFTAAEPGYGFVNELTPELSIAMMPEHRGKGIGRRLIEQLLENVPAVSLSCDPANPAWRLYLRLGFKPLADGRRMLRCHQLTRNP